MLQLMLVDGKSLVSEQMVLIDHVGRPTDSLFLRLLWLLAKGQKGDKMPGKYKSKHTRLTPPSRENRIPTLPLIFFQRYCHCKLRVFVM